MESHKTQTRRKATLTSFVDHWMVNGHNATKAVQAMAERKGKTCKATTASVRGSIYLAAAEAEGLVQARIERVTGAMGVDELIRRVSEYARADIADFVTIPNVSETGVSDGQQSKIEQLLSGPGWQFDLAKASRAGKTHLIKRLTHDAETGAPKVELHDALEAMRTLGQWYGLGRDPQAMQGQQAGITVNVLQGLPEGAAAALYRALVGAPEPVGAMSEARQVTDIQAMEASSSAPAGERHLADAAQLEQAGLAAGQGTHAPARVAPPTPPPTGGKGAGGDAGGSFTVSNQPDSARNSMMPGALRGRGGIELVGAPGMTGHEAVPRGAAVGGTPAAPFLRAPLASIRAVDDPHLPPIGSGFSVGELTAEVAPEMGGPGDLSAIYADALVPGVGMSKGEAIRRRIRGGIVPVAKSHLPPIGSDSGESPLAFLLEGGGDVDTYPSGIGHPLEVEDE